ncbi:MAG: asparaginase [Janthinobacterium lividum]
MTMQDSGAGLRRIAVIGTGGTISSVSEDSLDVLDYPEFSRKIDAAELLARVPEAFRVAEPVAVAFRAVSSTAIGPREWVALRDLVHATAAADPGVAGFVITHGTSTLEETAFFLNLTLRVAVPVVLVGAQRPASALGSDAGANLVAALRVASCGEAAGMGVLVVLNDEVHAARDVSKTSTYRLQTFRSADFGALGHVDGDAVRFARSPRGMRAPGGPFASAEGLVLPRVDVVVSYAGADGAMVEAAVAAGARGIVSAGFAPGCATPGEGEAFERAAAAGVVVVQCSRAGSGRVAPRRYLRGAGIVAGEDLSPQKARILLMLALSQGWDVARVSEVFAAV